MARLVAGKGILAARVDAAHESADAHIGQMFREEIEKKLDKLTVSMSSFSNICHVIHSLMYERY